MKRWFFVGLAAALLFLTACDTGLTPDAEQGSDAEVGPGATDQAAEKPVLTSIKKAAPAAEARRSGETGNDYPIVLLHGFAGWGPDEMLGYNYWGGLDDLEEYLNSRGHPAMTATVGPFSSNWDRACELYAYIKGGTVDYGKAHAAEHGHDRYGRTFEGIYPEWDADHPIHILGHSMGGQTMRVLVQLLEEGSPEERAQTPASELSPLFLGGTADGGSGWVMSATSLATPHDGTTLTDHVTSLIPMSQDILAAVSAAADGNGVYDFKLDQWGLTRRSGESWDQFADRVWNSGLWEDTKDLCIWDLSRPGAEDLNSWVEAAPEVYYFSISNECTYRGFFSFKYYPRFYMNPALQPLALTMGHNDSWSLRETDGVVNTASMDGPELGSSDAIVEYDGTAEKGVWNHLGVQHGWDHLAIVGQNVWSVRSLFREQAEILHGLPAR